MREKIGMKITKEPDEDIKERVEAIFFESVWPIENAIREISDVLLLCQEIRDEKQEEIEKLVWNLAGCSTYALGYGIHEGHNKSIALPALDDVLKLALKEEKERKRAEKLEGAIKEAVNQLGGPTMEYQPEIANQEKKKNIEKGVSILIKALESVRENEV